MRKLDNFEKEKRRLHPLKKRRVSDPTLGTRRSAGKRGLAKDPRYAVPPVKALSPRGGAVSTRWRQSGFEKT